MMTVAKAMKMAEKIEKIGLSNEKQNVEKKIINAEIINARFLKPLDEKTILSSIKKTQNVITIEDGTKLNGLGTAIKELIIDNNLGNIKVKSYAYPDEFIPHGSVEELEKIYMK